MSIEQSPLERSAGGKESVISTNQTPLNPHLVELIRILARAAMRKQREQAATADVAETVRTEEPAAKD